MDIYFDDINTLDDYYILECANLRRELPIIKLSDEMAIASFVLLGDAEMATYAALALEPLLPHADVILTAEAKGIPLVQEISRLRRMKRFIVARKSVKAYMDNPLQLEVKSITTSKIQSLVQDGKDKDYLQDKSVLLIDDVISTGESLDALEKLANSAGARVVAKAAILAEGKASLREDIIYLEALPLFSKK